MKTLLKVFAVSFAWLLTGPAQAWVFAEGYTSSLPGQSASLKFREFTIETGHEACDAAPAPATIEFGMEAMTLQPGDRIYRNQDNDLVIEARDSSGAFLPSIPIIVSVMADETVLVSRSDWEFLEAIASGSGTLLARYYCDSIFIVESSLEIIVTEH